MTILYSEIREKIRTGDLVAWDKPTDPGLTGLFLKLYQKITKARYTHVGVAVVLGERVMMVEATPPEVRLYPLSMSSDFYLIKTDISRVSKHLDIVLSELGKPYNLLDFFKNVIGFSDSNRDYYCSQLVSRYYNEIGYINNDLAGLTPDSIVEEVIKASSSDPIYVNVDRGNLNAI